MGFSEWGILLESKTDLENLLKLVEEHNGLDLEAETLDFYSVLEFQNKKYACIGNGGGGEVSSQFIRKSNKKYKFKKILYPFKKPKTWNECDKYLWKKESMDEKIPLGLSDVIKLE
ncbi:MAG: hypothetical protein Hyperionvirus1_80 [Hyperionvirus sp.]|uniref:Uncharacterized protein n=1 Tax=Hyperionvirus sp. TaxID=2487770 RepID=A0A3G5A8J6_9VIRU|nr:MAG: hypothetical protein Hyperionvirus1_80 [Hyperionvirus sp.]